MLTFFHSGFPLVSLFKLPNPIHLTMSRFAKEAALEEIRRVLKPGAKLGLIWNIEDCRIHPFLRILALG